LADTDGKVRIIIDTNAQQAAKELNDVGQAFKKNADTIKSSSSAYNSYEKAVRDNIQVLRELAIGGNQNTEGFKKLAAETKKYQDALRQANSEVDKAVGGMSKQANPVSALTSSLKGLIGAYIGLRGIQAVTQYVAQATEAFRTQERAVLSLNNTLANAGIYSEQYSQHIQELARSIQSYSNYGDEAIIKAQALGQAYIGQTKITDQLTKATVDFAAATGMDLDQAFTLVGKSIGSPTNALRRYGIELNKNMTDSEKMAAIAIQLGNRYEGQAKQMANASTQLKNAVGDLAEAFGSIFNPAIEKTQKLLTRLAGGLANNINLARAYRTEISKLNVSDAQARYNKNNERLYILKNQRITPKREIARVEKEQAQLREQIAKEQAKSLKQNRAPVKFTDEIGFSGGGAVASTKTAGARTTATAKAKQIKDAYEQAQEAVNNARRAVQNAALTYGTSSQQVQQAFQQYQQANEKLSAVDDLFKVTETKTKFQELNQQITDTTAKLQDLYLSGEGKSDAFKETKNKLVELQTQLQDMNTAITSSVGLNWQNVANSIRSNLTSALLTPLQQGESAFDRLGKIGLNVVQMIGQEIISNLLKQITLEKTLQTIKTVGKGIGGFFGGLFGSANGNVFRNGNVVPFARGGVVTKPTVFPMANGAGLMGEAGAEAIMPLTRRNGKLGVEGSATVVNIYNQSGANVETQKHDDGSVDVFIRRVNDALSNQRTSKGFRAAYQREDRKGVQAC
jgi:chromosome segregation ATPase